MTTKPAGVVRVVYQEVLEGDRRKFAAASNDSDTGGGARDLRFNHEHFGPVFSRMFRDSDTVMRRRGGVSTSVTVHKGKVWTAREGKVDQASDVTYEPPTSARPREGRLTKVHEMPGLIHNLPEDNGERLFLLFAEQDDNKVYAYFVTLADLAGWHWAVYEPIAACAAGAQGSSRKVVGWIDFSSNTNYCHERR